MKNNWHVATAAEAAAAMQFARFGFDVSVQYGANQPEYDIMVADGDRILKVSVKGSQDGGWGLTMGKLRNADYHAAADAWLKRHKRGTVIALVQFKGVSLGEMPRMWLAWPSEIAALLKSARAGTGDTILWENRTYGTKAIGAGQTVRVPEDWKLTPQRVEQLLQETPIRAVA
jgi:hypothetical protein